MMDIRIATVEDLPFMQTLFVQTVESVNSKDYSEMQIRAWTASSNDSTRWKEKFILSQYCLCATVDGQIVGFASLDHDYLDLLYVHKDFQGMGTAKTLLVAIIKEAISHGIATLYTDSSITALPFFLHHGFDLIRENRKELKGIELINYSMKKDLKSQDYKN
jgi:putative acetyltransferase